MKRSVLWDVLGMSLKRNAMFLKWDWIWNIEHESGICMEYQDQGCNMNEEMKTPASGATFKGMLKKKNSMMKISIVMQYILQHKADLMQNIHDKQSIKYFPEAGYRGMLLLCKGAVCLVWSATSELCCPPRHSFRSVDEGAGRDCTSQGFYM